MKQIILAVVLSLVSVSAFATSLVTADTLVVERFVSRGAGVPTSHVYKVRYATPALCAARASQINGIKTSFEIGNNPYDSIRFATCEAEDYSLQY